MRTVRQLLESKSAEVIAIAPDAPVIEAIKLMATHGIGALLATLELGGGEDSNCGGQYAK